MKLPKALNEATAGAALKYHIKRALERSHSISEFSKNLELSAQKSHFSNNTLKIIEELNNSVKQASEELSKKASDLQHATTPLKEFGTNYPEFALKPKEALEKLLQERNGQVAGAAYRDDLGGIDFVWGTPKTKESVGYGLAHVLERREQQALADGLSEAEAKEYALNIVKSIPEVLEKGTKGTDHLGRVFVDFGNKRVGLNNTWNNKDLENHWVISSYELRDTTEKPTHFPTSQAITKEKDIHSLNSVEPNPTTNTLKIIEELNNSVKSASEEIRSKVRDFSNEKLTNEQIKALLNNAEIPTSGRDAITFGTHNLNPEMVEFLHKNNKKMIIEKASNKEVELLKDAHFKHPENIRSSLDHDAITHILKRHGVNSVNVRNGEIPITYEDIANYRYIVNNADAILRTLDKYGEEAITAFKQINGYAVVVEQAVNKKNELVLKTMYKNNGSYKNNEAYKEFSSTSLNANAKVPNGLSSQSGAT
ncbi:DUF3519 domain-containing protein, partial [Helicobacter pylori]